MADIAKTIAKAIAIERHCVSGVAGDPDRCNGWSGCGLAGVCNATPDGLAIACGERAAKMLVGSVAE